MSISGMTDSVRTSGMSSFIFKSLAEALLDRYANAMWPTANVFFPPGDGKKETEWSNKSMVSFRFKFSIWGLAGLHHSVSSRFCVGRSSFGGNG